MTRKGLLLSTGFITIFYARLVSPCVVDWQAYSAPYAQFDLFVESLLAETPTAQFADLQLTESAADPADDVLDATSSELMAATLFETDDAAEVSLRVHEVGWRRRCQPILCEEVCAPVCETVVECDASLPMPTPKEEYPANAGFVVGGSMGPTGSFGGGAGGGFGSAGGGAGGPTWVGPFGGGGGGGGGFGGGGGGGGPPGVGNPGTPGNPDGPFPDDHVNPPGELVPEPASVVIWSTLLVLGGVLCWNRSRRSI